MAIYTEPRMPVPDWTRPNETWRVEPEDRAWAVVDGPDVPCCGERGRCSGSAAAVRHGKQSALGFCEVHLRSGGMWIENGRVVSWRLSR